MLAIIAAVILICWIFGFTAFHITNGAIHLLLIIGIILLIIHFVRGKNSV